MEIYMYALVALCLFCGLWMISRAVLLGENSTTARKIFKRYQKWYLVKTDVWDQRPMRGMVEQLAKVVYLPEAKRQELQNKLDRAGLTDSPRIHMAKLYLIGILGLLALALSLLAQFYFATFIVVLSVVYFYLRQNEKITDKIKDHDMAIHTELPRFVRTIARTLQADRDLIRVLRSYRKTAKPALGAELDTLILEMEAGNAEVALLHFQTRLDSNNGYRLCAALRDMSNGGNQSGNLQYIADNMSMQAMEEVRKEIAKRPNKMRATYIPAVIVCLIMMIYTLLQYILFNLNSIM